MVKRQETLNSLEEIKTDSENNCGQRPGLVTFYHGMKLRTRRKLLESNQANRQVPVDDHVDKKQEDDQGVDRDETDSFNEVIFGRRRPDSIAVDWTSKVLYVLEFKRTSDQGQNYRDRGENRARAQHGVLVKSLEKVAGEAD